MWRRKGRLWGNVEILPAVWGEAQDRAGWQRTDVLSKTLDSHELAHVHQGKAMQVESRWTKGWRRKDGKQDGTPWQATQGGQEGGWAARQRKWSVQRPGGHMPFCSAQLRPGLRGRGRASQGRGALSMNGGRQSAEDQPTNQQLGSQGKLNPST